MPLSQEQLDAVSTLDWLFDPGEMYRGTGRTTIMAVGIIRAAARYPGTPVPVVDHVENSEIGKRRLLDTIQGLIEEDDRLGEFMVLRISPNPSFTLNLPVPMDNWLPAIQGHPAPPGAYVRERVVDRGGVVPDTTWERLVDAVSTPREPPPTVYERILANDSP